MVAIFGLNSEGNPAQYAVNSALDKTADMDDIKESRWYNTNYILEIESMLVNERYRTGSPMQE